jgi:hypothetical protein
MESNDNVNAAWMRGDLAWTAVGLTEAFAVLPTLGETAPDRLSQRIGEDAGAAPEKLLAREIVWLIARYGERDGPAHALRLFQVRRFLVAHRDRLATEGLYYQPEGGLDPDAFVLSRGLTHALATLPYSQRARDVATSGEDATLDYDAVVQVARRIDDSEQ